MPKSWQDEVREILQQSDTRRPQGARPRGGAPRPPRAAGNLLEVVGAWTRRRFATTSEMLITAAVLVVLALFLSIFLRQIASIAAVAAGVIFAAALVRGILERRRGGAYGTANRPVMWRGQVIELHERRPSLLERLRGALRRRK